MAALRPPAGVWEVAEKAGMLPSDNLACVIIINYANHLVCAEHDQRRT